MDTKITLGDIATNAQGMPVQINGHEEFLQRALVLIAVPLGKFVYNKTLGSKIHTVKSSDEHRLEKVFSYASLALRKYPDLSVLGVIEDDEHYIFTIKTPFSEGEIFIRREQ